MVDRTIAKQGEAEAERKPAEPRTWPTVKQRLALLDELKWRVLYEPRLPDGRRSHWLTPADWRMYRATLDHLDDESGDCAPHPQALAKEARVSSYTVGLAMHRLRAAGWISWVPEGIDDRAIPGRQYIFPLTPPDLAPRGTDVIARAP